MLIASANQIVTRCDVVIAPMVANSIALFSSFARRLSGAISAFRCAIGPLSSIAFKARDLSMILFIRAMRTEVYVATELSRKAGPVIR